MDTIAFLQIVYDKFRIEGRWPLVRELLVQFRDKGNVKKIAAEIGEQTVVCEDRTEGVCFLKLEGIATCTGSEIDVRNFLGLIRFVASRYVRSGSEKITSDEIKTELNLTDQELIRLREIIQREPGIWSQASWSSDKPNKFHLEAGENAAFFENVNSVEEFTSTQQRVWQDERDAAALRFGWHPMDQAARPSDTETPYDRFHSWWKNNRIIVTLVVAFGIVVALAVGFTNIHKAIEIFLPSRLNQPVPSRPKAAQPTGSSERILPPRR